MISLIFTGFDGYFVKRDGTFWSMKRGKLKKLKIAVNSKGYGVVGLSAGGVTKSFAAHVLILKAFRGRPPFSHQVACHNNGIRNDNRLVNLRWGSVSSNQLDRIKHGTWHDVTAKRGEENQMSKLRPSDIPKIRKLLDLGYSRKRIAGFYSVTASTIDDVANGKTWRHIS